MDHDAILGTLDAPWGRYAPAGSLALLVRLSRAVPTWPLVKQLVFPLRRAVRRRVDGPVDYELWGHRLRFVADGNISEGALLFFPDRWDCREREFLARELRPGAVFVDVGANFGGYTWWILSRLGRRCRGLLLEPDPALHAQLARNLEENGVENVRALPTAAGAAAHSATLHLGESNRGQSSLVEHAGTGASARTVAVRPLLDLVREEGFDRLDLVKIDIEGMEPRVLDAFFGSAPESLWPRLLCTERHDTDGHAAMEARLLELGYRVALRTRLNLILRRDG